MDSNTPKTSKVRREQLKSGTDEMKQYFPLNEQERKDLSQLQALHFACIYLRKISLFAKLPPNVQEQYEAFYQNVLPTQQNLVEGLCGYLIALSRDGNLLYVSDNVVDYLGLKSIDVLLSCDKIYEVLHPYDETDLRRILENRENTDGLLCSWNASKIRRKQHSRTDLKVIKMTGHFIPYTDVFVALCVPQLNITNRECLCAISPLCFTSVHKLDMKFIEICTKGENLLGYNNNQITNVSLYDLLNVNDLDQIRTRHKNLLSTKSQKGKIDTVKILKKNGAYVDCLVNIYYSSNNMIICRYQILSNTEMSFYQSYMEARSQNDDNQNQTDDFFSFDDNENSSSFSDTNNANYNSNNEETFNCGEQNFGAFDAPHEFEFKREPETNNFSFNIQRNKRKPYEVFNEAQFASYEPARKIILSQTITGELVEQSYPIRLNENMVTINQELINQEIELIPYREEIDIDQLKYALDACENNVVINFNNNNNTNTNANSSNSNNNSSNNNNNIYMGLSNNNYNINSYNTVQQIAFNDSNNYASPSSAQCSELSYSSTPSSPEQLSMQKNTFEIDLSTLNEIENIDISFDDITNFQSPENVEAAFFNNLDFNFMNNEVF